ncbi:hypothetical protein GA0070624_3982 [Micromonospora rhizosphaerae]|uniref:Uncharacterized protein n=1 Tax=Micromonospora rhizosphaerae TaxID=568872 RepID=A0A1C6SKL4_9ACTN|nr:hypothetical protein GA0070624_3982 [Micromonospora rhizosphaerae]
MTIRAAETSRPLGDTDAVREVTQVRQQPAGVAAGGAAHAEIAGDCGD